MAKADPMKLPLKGSTLPQEIVNKLVKLTIANPDATFGSKPESITLVRHLMWAVRRSQMNDKLSGSVIQISSICEVLNLTAAEVETIVSFLQTAIGTSFSRLYR